MRVQAPSTVFVFAAALAALLCPGCIDRDLAVLQPRVSRSIDQPVSSEGVASVDLLLVIDDSGSMEEEQEILREQIPLLVRGLTSPPDEDDNGYPDWSPVESLRVAVVTTDLGTNGLDDGRIRGCGLTGAAANLHGRDGELRADPSCGGSGDPIAAWATGDDVDSYVSRVGCLAEAGSNGCGFEQPLLAAARALSRGAEHGFPRDDALLAVLVLTDEEDCSLREPRAFYDSLADIREANRHCTSHTELLSPVEDLVHEISAGRDPEGGMFLFAAITGVPVDLAGESPDVVLSDDRMGYVHADTPTGLRYACEAHSPEGPPGAFRSRATPARRLVELASLVPGSLVRSICEDSFRPAMAELTRRIGARIEGVCLGRALVPDLEGRVDCQVEETLPAGHRCADTPGRASVGHEGDRETCIVQQAPGGSGSGWYYDLSNATCDRISFTDDAIPPLGTRMRFHCLVEVPSDEDERTL